MLPHGAGASASDVCPACGQEVDPDVTLHPGPAPLTLPPVVQMPTRLPVGLLVGLAVSCALMGVALGLWIAWRPAAPAPRTEVRLPALPPPVPAYDPPMPPPRVNPAPADPSGGLSLPPPRVAPPGSRPLSENRREPGVGWPRSPVTIRPRETAPRPAPSKEPRPPLKAKGMATVRVTNPTQRAIDVSLSGAEDQLGVVAPRAVMDFLVPPGRYDVALKGAARTQRFYDAPLAEGEVLALVYAEGT
jgi:hypothetical protein